MSPLEIAIRAACKHIGADPESWRGFEEIGQVAAAALVAALPAELSDPLRRALGLDHGEPS